MKPILIAMAAALASLAYGDDLAMCVSIDSREWAFKSIEGESLVIAICAVAHNKDGDVIMGRDSGFSASIKMSAGKTIYEFPMDTDGNHANEMPCGIMVQDRGDIVVISFDFEEKNIRLSFRKDEFTSIKNKWIASLRLVKDLNLVWPRMAAEFRQITMKQHDMGTDKP